MSAPRHPALAWRPCAAALALAGLASGAFAETPQDRWWGQLEYFFPTISSTARLDFPGTNVPGTELNLEDELGLDERKGAPYLLLGARLGERWRLEFEYYRLNRSATRSAGRTIEWGDLTFPVSSAIQSTFDTSIYRLTGGYSFYRTPQGEVGVSLGLHTTDFKLQLAGQGTSPGSTLTFQSEARDQLVPLPTIGAYGSWMLSDQWELRGRVDYLSLSYQQYDGRLINWMAAVDWRVAKNWGVGAGYRYVDYKLESTKTSFHGEVNYRFKGPTLFLEAGF
jgi:hypothetical protein